jgi:hypothetical protein
MQDRVSVVKWPKVTSQDVEVLGSSPYIQQGFRVGAGSGSSPLTDHESV